jgi:hypothetical protein
MEDPTEATEQSGRRDFGTSALVPARINIRRKLGKLWTGSCEEIGREWVDNAIAEMIDGRTLHV